MIWTFRGEVAKLSIGERSKQTTLKATVDYTQHCLTWSKTIRGDEHEQSHEAVPKKLILPLPYRIIRLTGSRDIFSDSSLHASTRMEKISTKARGCEN